MTLSLSPLGAMPPGLLIPPVVKLKLSLTLSRRHYWQRRFVRPAIGLEMALVGC